MIHDESPKMRFHVTSVRGNGVIAFAIRVNEAMIRSIALCLLVFVILRVDVVAQETSDQHQDPKGAAKRFAGVLHKGFASSKVQVDLGRRPVEISTQYLFRLRNDKNRHPMWVDAQDIKLVSSIKQLESLYGALDKAPPRSIKDAYSVAECAYSFKTYSGVPGKMHFLRWLLIVRSSDDVKAVTISHCINVEEEPDEQELVKIDKLEPALSDG